MGEGHLEKTLKAVTLYVLFWMVLSGLLLIGGWWLADQYLDARPVYLLGGLVTGWLILSLIIGSLIARSATAPLKALSEAILHISPSPIPVKSPDINKLRLGRELIAGLIRQVYELNTSTAAAQTGVSVPAGVSLEQLPVAVIALDQDSNITYANRKARELVSAEKELIGSNLYGVFDILFQTEETLGAWIEKARDSAVTAQKIWHEVRVNTYGDEVQYIDLAATYSKTSGEQTSEVLLTLFDETDVYAQQDRSLSFIALAVHELRTPLTLLRGYIEVFEEELDTAKPELKEYMRRTRVATETLTAFVGNILDVARLDQNQLTLRLNKEDWREVLTSIVKDMELRAKVRDKTIELSIGDNLPPVGVDRISISEVLMNLIDNAIKYSPPDKKTIKVSAYQNKEGLVETVVQDYGVGIPEAVLPHLFEKFSRSHRSRASISGTGLGLYLSKALVSAHGGNIWVRSHEGEGSIFGFTLLPFDQVAKQSESGDNGITRSAHGWIKNHSLSRR